MKDLIKLQQKLVPDLVDKMYRRFSILTTISNNEPVAVSYTHLTLPTNREV